MTGKLAGKVAIITGASAGIGRASAIALAREGANLIVTARRMERLQAVVAEVEALGVRAVPVTGDVRDEATAEACVAAATGTFGRINVLLNNTGIGNYKPFVETSLADYADMMDTNVRSTFLFTRHVVPVMIGQGEGQILIISSMAGVYGFPNQAIYCASKFAQMGFAQGLDRELRPHGIKVGTINPGGVKTEFALGKGRTEEGVAQSSMLEPEDVAEAVLFACCQPKGARIIEMRMRTMAEQLF